MSLNHFVILFIILSDIINFHHSVLIYRENTLA